MAKTVKENTAIVLEALYSESPKKSNQFEIDGKRIQELTNLSPQEINDAVSILNDTDYVGRLQELGTGPFDFSCVWITPMGKMEYEQLKEKKEYEHTSPPTKTMISETTVPVSSQSLIHAKLRAQRNAVAALITDPRSRYFDPFRVMEYFERYTALSVALRTQIPKLFGDLPVRDLPTASGTTDFEGRGYITRETLARLLEDMNYIDDLFKSVPAAEVPSVNITKEGVFFKGQYFDALQQVVGFVKDSKDSIVLIDGYISGKTLDLLSDKASSATVQILTKDVKPAVLTLAQAFNKQHGRLQIRSSQAFHDRFLIIDNKDYYHFGASIKDLGEKGFMFSAIEEPEVLAAIQHKFSQEWASAKVLV